MVERYVRVPGSLRQERRCALAPASAPDAGPLRMLKGDVNPKLSCVLEEIRLRVLVTGGAGFIGSHIVELLLDLGHQAIVVDDLSGGGPPHVPEKAEFHRISVLDSGLTQLCTGIDAVVHAAAQTSVADSVEKPVQDALTNIAGTVQTVRSAALGGVRRFIYLSSAAVYANQGSPPFTEGQRLAPISPYGLSKWAGEEYVRLLGSMWGHRWVILRLANVYGPRQSGAGEAGVIARWVHAISSGKPVTIHGDGGQTRDFIHVRDVSEAVVRALDTPLEGGCILNVGSGSGTAIRDLLPILESHSGRKATVFHEPPRAGDIRHSALDCRSAKDLLGWGPRIDVVAGLAHTVSALKDG